MTVEVSPVTSKKLNSNQIEKLNRYLNGGDVAGGWNYLASLGDSYADNAAGVIDPTDTTAYNRMMHEMVKHVWHNTVGVEA